MGRGQPARGELLAVDYEMKGAQRNRVKVGKLDRHHGVESLVISRTPGIENSNGDVDGLERLQVPVLEARMGNRGRRDRLVSWTGGRGRRSWIVLAMLRLKDVLICEGNLTYAC